MSKKRILFILSISIVTITSGIYMANAGDLFKKIHESGLRKLPGNIMVKENSDRQFSEAYTFIGDQVEKVKTESKFIKVRTGTPDERTVELLKFIKDGKVETVLPKEAGGLMDFQAGKKRIVYTDFQDLMVADIETLKPVNLQPDTVGGISQKALYDKKWNW